MLLVSSENERQAAVRMKRYGELYPQIYDFANLQSAYLKARKCKRYRAEVLQFTLNLEENLINIQNHLIWKSYRPQPYRMFKIYEPKERQIMALPFTDRVVQHAINNILEPIFDKRFYFHSYACRKEKGMHAASEQLTEWLYNLHFDGKRLFVLQGDIHHCFQSIDHTILKALIRNTIKCKDMLWIIDLLIDHSGVYQGKGIPVGNLTSQLFANLYMNELDKYLKETLHVKYYIRYMDDFVILSYDKAYLWEILRKIGAFLWDHLALELNPKTKIYDAKNGIDFVGYRHWYTHKMVRKSSIKRTRRTIKQFHKGKLSEERMQKTMQSWLGHISHADTWHLRQAVFAELESGSPKGKGGNLMRTQKL